MNQTVYGVVATELRYCILYSRPSIMSKGLARLQNGELLEIDEDNSTACYYKVRTERNDEGYVMICDVDKKEDRYG